MKKRNLDETIECKYQGMTLQVPLRTFLEVTLRMEVDGKFFVRYKEGARLFSISEREFYILAHDAGAVYKWRKIALVKVDEIVKYLEYFRANEENWNF